MTTKNSVSIACMIIAAMSALAMGDHPSIHDSVKSSVCGDVEDVCMNEENFASCKQLEENGCVEILVMESCPLEFSCTDQGWIETTPTVSASFDVYSGSDCQGEPSYSMSLMTYDGPRGHGTCLPMNGDSIDGHYCAAVNDKAVFHQTIYYCSEECATPWWRTYWGEAEEQVFEAGACVDDKILISCEEHTEETGTSSSSEQDGGEEEG